MASAANITTTLRANAKKMHAMNNLWPKCLLFEVLAE